MINDEPAPTGRPAGALGWAGLANCFFWIDRQNGIGGFWATQIFPFGDAVLFAATWTSRPRSMRAWPRQRPPEGQLFRDTGVIPTLSHDAEFFPGLKKSWCYTFMINDEDAPTGRPAGALGWAGLANCFFWIDRQNGIGGFWATQILPFGDAVSFPGYMDFETAVYASLAAAKAA